MILSLLFLAGLAASQEEPILAVPGWHSDLEEGTAEARETGRPLMVVFR